MRRILAAAALATQLSGGSALAVEVIDIHVHNCMDMTLRVITYDEHDLVQMVPYATYHVPPKQIALVQCKGDTKCKVRLFYGDSGEYYETGETLYVRYSSLIGVYRTGTSCQFF